MKRILFIAALVICAGSIFSQEKVKVTNLEGRLFTGYFVDGTDSTYTIKCSDQYIIKKYGTDTLTFALSEIREVYMYDKTFIPYEGKLVAKNTVRTQVGKEFEVISENGDKSKVYINQQSDPNYVIGKAMKKTGGVAIGFGIPCLVSGSIFMAVGLSDKTHTDITKVRLGTAGSILFPIGASLTIVGIPLHAHGKKLMDINFNYTGNGVGVAMNF